MFLIASAAWFNPQTREKGKAKMKDVGENRSEVYIQLQPGQSIILQFYPDEVQMEDYPVWNSSGEKIALNGERTVAFEKGGPTLPDSYKISELKSWTEQSDELKNFPERPATKLLLKNLPMLLQHIFLIWVKCMNLQRFI